MLNVKFALKENDPKTQDVFNKIAKNLDKKKFLIKRNINYKVPFLLISIGGDGTFIKMVQTYANYLNNAVFTSINVGQLGFYSNYTADEWTDFVKSLNKIDLTNLAKQKDRLLNIDLVEIKYDQQIYYAINEAIVTKPSKTLIAQIYINDLLLEQYIGTGLICATPYGSTGINKSLHGPILSENINGFILNEMIPCNNIKHHSLNTALVLSEKDVVKIEIKKTSHNNECFVMHDNKKIKLDIERANKVYFYKSNKKLKFLKTHKFYNFIERIKKSFIQ